MMTTDPGTLNATDALPSAVAATAATINNVILRNIGEILTEHLFALKLILMTNLLDKNDS